MDQNKSGSLSDEDPGIFPCKREENDSDEFESVDAPSAPSDGNRRARKRPQKNFPKTPTLPHFKKIISSKVTKINQQLFLWNKGLKL